LKTKRKTVVAVTQVLTAGRTLRKGRGILRKTDLAIERAGIQRFYLRLPAEKDQGMDRLNWLWQDLRYSLRSLKNDRSFCLVAIFALALGIGCSTIVFSVVYNLLFDPYAAKNTKRWAVPGVHNMKQSGKQQDDVWFSIHEYQTIREENHIFDDLMGSYHADMLYDDGGGTRQILGLYLTANSFQFMGVAPLMGRGILPDDGDTGAPPVFVIGYNMWKDRFRADPTVIGRSFTINGKPRTLVGVMPRRFQAGGVPIWLPLSLGSESESGNGNDQVFLYVVGRVKPNVGLAAAAADLDVIAKRLAKIYPRDFPEQFTMTVQWASESLMGPFIQTLYALLVAVLMLLLIGCSNVANLLLARATARGKEIALRAALGASNKRLIRQLLVESFVLAAAASLVGVLIAYWGLKGVVAVIPQGRISGEAVIGLNPEVLLFTIGVTSFTALICGLTPALHAVRGSLYDRLIGSGKGTNGAYRHTNLRSCLVITEVALSVVLLVGAVLMMRSFFELTHMDLGFNPAKVFYTELATPSGRYDTAQQKKEFLRKILDRVERLPGVTAAAESISLPPLWTWKTRVSLYGATRSDPWEGIVDPCSEGYFKTLGLQLLRGREFSRDEVEGLRHVALVNKTFVERYFENRDAIGQQVKIDSFDRMQDAPHNAAFEIVGVISDFRNQGLQESPFPEVFVPYTVTGFGPPTILARTDVNPLAIVEDVRREVWTVDPNVALGMTGSLELFVEDFGYREPKFDLITIGCFGGMGLLLVAMGVYSVMAYTISLQTSEIGIRMALGAQRVDIFRMILRRGLMLIAIGILIGVFLSFSLTQFLASQTTGISVADPWTLAVVIVVLVVVGILACTSPARKATRVDPLVALRSE
jgi:putative ABC transport system permease protein